MNTNTADTEQQLLLDAVRRFAKEQILPKATEIDRTDQFPRALYQAMGEMGLFGIALPESAGGSGMSIGTACLAMEEIACASGSVGNMFAIPLEAVLLLNEHGNDYHKSFIPGILNGTVIPATAVTESDAGSDVASMKTTAIRDGDSYIINGSKAWVTFGGVFDYVVVFAKTSREPGHGNISAFLVEANALGIVRGRNEELLGMHGLEDCQVTFENVRVPVQARLGEENRAFKMAMVNFNVSRVLMSAMTLGMARAAFEDSVLYAKNRKQFGGRIFDFQAIQFMLADMSVDITASRLLIMEAAKLHDQGASIAKEAAQAKLFTTDMAMKHATNAIQIHGGAGYSKDFRVERIFRDVKLPQIYEGTNQIQRIIIARQIDKEMP
jgi:alkylation response protein AidB-like acyl-CoA dehydrogenase